MSIFNGRINRACFGLGLGLIVFLLVLVDLFVDKPASVSEVILIFLAIPRLHDIGKSGWFVLIGLAVEAGGIALGLSASDQAMPMIMGVAVLVMFGLMVWLAFIPGEPGPNQWGDPPEPGLGSFFKRKPT